MTDKKRTTVTTIETHEVWIVRKGALEPVEETEPQLAIPTLAEDNPPSPETDKTKGETDE